jgi:hypothetical protein
VPDVAVIRQAVTEDHNLAKGWCALGKNVRRKSEKQGAGQYSERTADETRRSHLDKSAAIRTTPVISA